MFGKKFLKNIITKFYIKHFINIFYIFTVLILTYQLLHGTGCFFTRWNTFI
jgi:hypothetical protein